MSRKIILIKQELLLLVYELNRSGLLAENEKIRPILAQLEKLLLCRSEERFSRNAETDLVCRLLPEKKDANVSMVREASSSSATRIAGNPGCNSRSREIHAAPDSPAAPTTAGCFARADARLDGSAAPCSTETSHPAPSISSASSAETRTSGN